MLKVEPIRFDEGSAAEAFKKRGGAGVFPLMHSLVSRKRGQKTNEPISNKVQSRISGRRNRNRVVVQLSLVLFSVVEPQVDSHYDGETSEGGSATIS